MTTPSNAEAVRTWGGEDGAYWAAHEKLFETGMAGYTGPLLDGAAIAAGDRVLDVGCGNGGTTRAAARRAGTGRVTGADLSADMLAVARRRAVEENLANVEFVQADAQLHDFGTAAYDALISRFGVMFFDDPAAAFGNLAAAVRPGGRLALMVWQGADANEWQREIVRALAAGRTLPTPAPGAPGPLALADPARVRALLGTAGFDSVQLTTVAEPMWFGADPETAFGFVAGLPFARFLVRDLDGEVRAAALDALRATIAAHAGADGVRFGATAWLVTASRG